MEKLYDESWAPVIKPLFRQEYMKRLSVFVQEERRRYEVYPPQELDFNAFRLTPFSEVKVVILGQEPYHNEGQAHRPTPSAPEGVAFPPALKQIFAARSTETEAGQTPASGHPTTCGAPRVPPLA